MKTVLLALVALAIAQLSFAQVNKGAVLIGAGLYANHSYSVRENMINNQTLKIKGSTTTLGFSPSIGYFTSSSFMIGVGLGYQFEDEKAHLSNPDKLESINNSHIFSINPYVKKYIELSDKVYFSLHTGITAGMGRSNNLNNEPGTGPETDFYMIGAEIAPGLSYFINAKWALFANYGSLFYQFSHDINYRPGTSEISTTTNRNNFGASFSLNTFDLGIQYFLRTE